MAKPLLELKRWLNGIHADDSLLVTLDEDGGALVVGTHTEPIVVVGTFDLGVTSVAVAAKAAPAKEPAPKTETKK